MSSVLLHEHTSALVGRESEIAPLRARVSRALVGHGSVVVITGAAGVGKSRLMAEIQSEGRDRGMLLLSATADQVSGPIPYRLFTEVVGQCLGETTPQQRNLWQETLEKLAPHHACNPLSGS